MRSGRLCIEVTPESKIAFISENLCIGCGICPKKCPFGAITIINLPTNLESQITHRYSANSFKLHRLPTPRPGQVLGLVGSNGIGKSTALKILSGKLKPNLGRYDNPPDWQDVIKYFRGSELQSKTLCAGSGKVLLITRRLLHQNPRRWSQSHCETTICWPYSKGYTRAGQDCARTDWGSSFYGKYGRSIGCTRCARPDSFFIWWKIGV